MRVMKSENLERDKKIDNGDGRNIMEYYDQIMHNFIYYMIFFYIRIV